MGYLEKKRAMQFKKSLHNKSRIEIAEDYSRMEIQKKNYLSSLLAVLST